MREPAAPSSDSSKGAIGDGSPGGADTTLAALDSTPRAGALVTGAPLGRTRVQPRERSLRPEHLGLTARRLELGDPSAQRATLEEGRIACR